MRALTANRIGEPADVLGLARLPDPVPGPGEVVVRVHLASVNEAGLHVIRGRFERQPRLPASLGMEAVGVVEAVGAGVSGRTIGTRVVLPIVGGTWRDKVLAAAGRVIAVPDEVSDDDAA